MLPITLLARIRIFNHLPNRHSLLNILLISTYELGHQPFGLASPAAWLRNAGFKVNCLDLAVEPVQPEVIQKADLIAFYVPMHTATRLAIEQFRHIKEIKKNTHFCFYGLYAPMNEPYLRKLGVRTILGGEFETGLVSLCLRLRDNGNNGSNGIQPEPVVSLEKQNFVTPYRKDLPALSKYAHLCYENAPRKIVGYVEASRGCKHKCRHCPVVPVYNGRFRIVDRGVVLNDIRQQVLAGAQHITFGDPDFFNGIGHAIPIIEALHDEFPDVTYDATIKIEHLLKHDQFLPTLKETGCAFVTSAVETIDNQILTLLNKGHTRADFLRVVNRFNELDLVLNPTFMPFTPWATLEGYRELLQMLYDLNLVANVSPIQLAIRMLVPQGSKLLELEEMKKYILPFNEEKLMYEWLHGDPKVDEIQEEVFRLVMSANNQDASRWETFTGIWDLVHQKLNLPTPNLSEIQLTTTIPYLEEPWYC